MEGVLSKVIKGEIDIRCHPSVGSMDLRAFEGTVRMEYMKDLLRNTDDNDDNGG